jgi:hypothetical protein
MCTLTFGHLVSDVRVIVELFERDVNTSWTRAFDFIERFLLGWLWLGVFVMGYSFIGSMASMDIMWYLQLYPIILYIHIYI